VGGRRAPEHVHAHGRALSMSTTVAAVGIGLPRASHRGRRPWRLAIHCMHMHWPLPFGATCYMVAAKRCRGLRFEMSNFGATCLVWHFVRVAVGKVLEEERSILYMPFRICGPGSGAGESRGGVTRPTSTKIEVVTSEKSQVQRVACGKTKSLFGRRAKRQVWKWKSRKCQDARRKSSKTKRVRERVSDVSFAGQARHLRTHMHRAPPPRADPHPEQPKRADGAPVPI
jgi:hypothetical protein